MKHHGPLLGTKLFGKEGYLPDGKGYLEAHFYQNKLDVYWADKDFGLKAALEGVREQMPAPTSFADAQYGFSFEVAWWTKYTDAH